MSRASGRSGLQRQFEKYTQSMIVKRINAVINDGQSVSPGLLNSRLASVSLASRMRDIDLMFSLSTSAPQRVGLPNYSRRHRDVDDDYERENGEHGGYPWRSNGFHDAFPIR
jgi:hypothetical protein